MFKSLSFVIGGLLIGLTVGFLWANYTTRKSVAGQAAIAAAVSGVPNGISGTSGSPTAPEGQAGMMPDILKVIEQADKNKNDFDLQIRAGALYAQISRPEKALEYFNNAAALNPSDVDRIRQLGDVFFDIGNFAKSREYYLRADSLRPNSTEILTPLGVTFLAVEPAETEIGMEYLQRALKIDANYQPALVNLGLAYVKLGDRNKAREVRERLNGIAPNSDLVTRLDEAMKNAPFSRR